MSYIHFLGQGVNSPKLSEYHRENYDATTVESVGTSHKFNGEIKVIDTDSNDKKTVLMDEAVKITTVADDVRSKANSFWSRAHKGAMITFVATLIGGIAGITAAIVVGALLPALWPVALAVGLVSLGILGFSFFNLYRANEAKDQTKQWDDPIPHLQQQRRKAGETGNEGFHYSYQEKLKNQIISPEELKALWYRGMEYFVDRFGPSFAAGASIVRKFMEQAPIGDGPFTYTFGFVPEDDHELNADEKFLLDFSSVDYPADSIASPEEKFLSKLSGQFAGMKVQYDVIHRETEGLKALIYREEWSRIKANDAQLRANMAPFNYHYGMCTLPLDNRKWAFQSEICGAKEEIATLQMSDGGVAYDNHRNYVPVGARSAERSCAIACLRRQISEAKCEIRGIDSEISRLKLMYAAMTAPIRDLHRRNEASIKSWASTEVNNIQASEDQTLLKFHQPIKDLLERYAHRNDQLEGVDSDVNTEIKVDMVPSAPPLEEEYELPEYKPEWREIVGEVDWDNLKVTQTTRKDREETTDTRYA